MTIIDWVFIGLVVVFVVGIFFLIVVVSRRNDVIINECVAKGGVLITTDNGCYCIRKDALIDIGEHPIK